MAKTSFKFAADSGTSTDDNYVAAAFTYKMHVGIGESTAQESVAVGNPLSNSGLTNPLASTDGNGDALAGTHCRAWSWESVLNSHCHAGDQGSTAVLTDAAGGSLYPVTDTPANGTFVSYSVRAFLRINATNDVSASSAQGAFVGMQIKGKDAQGSDTSLYSHSTAGSTPRHGYSVALGSLKNRDDATLTTPGINSENLRLRFSSNNQSNPNNTGGTYETATGTYNFDTWYHVRFDCIPSVGADTIKVYTAPVSGVGSAASAGLGSETWTEVISTDITAGSSAYRAWDDSTYDRVGYFFSIKNSSYNAAASAAVGRHVPCIEKFQFLADDIS